MSNRLYQKGYWKLTPVRISGNPVTTGYVTRKAAVAIGTKAFGFTGMDVEQVSQFINDEKVAR